MAKRSERTSATTTKTETNDASIAAIFELAKLLLFGAAHSDDTIAHTHTDTEREKEIEIDTQTDTRNLLALFCLASTEASLGQGLWLWLWLCPWLLRAE